MTDRTSDTRATGVCRFCAARHAGLISGSCSPSGLHEGHRHYDGALRRFRDFVPTSHRLHAMQAS